MKNTRIFHPHYNWYYNFRISLELIESFLIDSEVQIEERIKEIESKISIEVDSLR